MYGYIVNLRLAGIPGQIGIILFSILKIFQYSNIHLIKIKAKVKLRNKTDIQMYNKIAGKVQCAGQIFRS